MSDELKDQRVVTMMSPSELAAIDDWMFENRVRSRGEAIRRLCQMGIHYRSGVKATFRASVAINKALSEQLVAALEAMSSDNGAPNLTEIKTALATLVYAHRDFAKDLTKASVILDSVAMIGLGDDLAKSIDRAKLVADRIDELMPLMQGERGKLFQKDDD